MNETFHQSFSICPDCNGLYPTAEGELCVDCAAWLDRKRIAIAQEYQESKQRVERLRMAPGQRFAEGLADMAKLMERSKQ
jgi:hypothetical protein